MASPEREPPRAGWPYGLIPSTPIKSTLPFLFCRGLAGLSVAVLLPGTAACQHDADPPAPENFPAPTPYALALPTLFPAAPAQPANNSLTVEGVELGRHLFYEKALSLDNSTATVGVDNKPSYTNFTNTFDNSATDASFTWSTNLLVDNVVLLRKQVQCPLVRWEG